tara:strand:- start:15 stop:626 length:612 start_codon:yes stop_codon:yes gene_type:complete
MLTKLPNDVMKIVPNHLNIFDIMSLSSVSKDYHYLKTIFEKDIVQTQEKKEMIRLFFSRKIIELMGGMRNMLLFPILEWKNKYLGATGYIDGITPEDLSSSIMIGKDKKYHRPFITIRTIDKDKRKNITTLFQRYTNEKKTWSHGNYGNGFITESGHFMNRGIIKHELLPINICNLLNHRGYIMQNSYTDPYEIDKIEDYYLV